MTDVRDEIWDELLEAGKVRWMPGMHVIGERARWRYRIDQEPGTPDWDDPATLGCLTAMAREAWGRAHIFAHYDGGDDEAADEEEPGRWMVYAPWEPNQDWAGCIVHGCDTEAEALLRAIAAAPR